MPLRREDGQPGGPAEVEALGATLPGDAPLAAGGATSRVTQLGRYQLLRLLGEGAMGEVWRARDPHLGRQVAIKLVHPRRLRTPDAGERLLREARAMARVVHPAVIAIYDAGAVDEQLYIAMELIDGESLGARLRDASAAERRDWRRWLTICRAAGAGLGAAHRAGVLHRDFKPDNVMVDRADRARVGDFGLADLRGSHGVAPAGAVRPDLQRPITEPPGEPTIELTTTGSLLGTPAYMSPEQLRGEPATAASDQFSFCATTWEAIYGARPFAHAEVGGYAAIAAIEAAICGAPPRVPPGAPRVPRRIHDALVRGLAADPGARWPSLDALLGQLAPRQVSRWLLGLGALVVVALAVGATALYVGRDDAALARPVPLEMSVPLKGIVRLAPDGTQVAISTIDTVVVRALVDGQQRAVVAATRGGAIYAIQYQASGALLIAESLPGNGQKVQRWDPATGRRDDVWHTSETVTWFGMVGDQHLVADVRGPGPYEMTLVRGDQRRVLATSLRKPQLGSVAPDDRHIAWLEPVDTFRTVIRVADAKGDVRLVSPPLIDLTTVAWLDDATLLYGTGSERDPRVLAVALDAPRWDAPRLVYEQAHGWLGQLDGRAGRAVVILSSSLFRGRAFELAPPFPNVDLGAGTVSATLGWKAPDTLWTWSGLSTTISNLTLALQREPWAARFTGDPANATIADEVVIVARRSPGGRVVSGHAPEQAEPLWTLPAGASFLVRCAGDARPPCVTAQPAADDSFALAWIDPRTGAVGAEVRAPSRFTDVALAPDGATLATTSTTGEVTVGPLAGPPTVTFASGLTVARSVAFDPRGGVLVAGSVGYGSYAIVRRDPDGRLTTMVSTNAELVSLVRPSPDGLRASYVGRTFASEAFLLDVAGR